MAKISVDWDLCESNGVCEAMASDVFHLDDDDLLQVDDPIVTDENRERVERAVAGCPRAALSIVED
ncbi:ferredoxin [Nocardioides sp.]|jgi:ferredoxin|uniref:ferredoxin n=1 Tax=Nocardioides sp. TaxID=35761 RepID=UPI002B6E5C00|nr:ferredoxin [Nocardioides sp.]HVX55268.1 ferredoxin [Nocardioides sp.]